MNVARITVARMARPSAAVRPVLPVTIDLLRSVRGWTPAVGDIAAWASAALGMRSGRSELGVRVVTPEESRQLNRQYRGRDVPTNVLSFPVAVSTPAAWRGPRPIGDLVVCAALVRAEAAEQGKALRAHWAHLIVHGVLHLAGFDHERETDARRMERREISILRRLGFPNPYATGGA
jgi:probable rRNA maturation factor